MSLSTNLTATGDISTVHSELIGFYVNSTTSGTIVLKSGGASGDALGGTITPAVGFHQFPANGVNGLHATIGGTLNVTFFYRKLV